MKTGIEMIAAERERQISRENWTSEHDDEHKDGELAIAAACYASPQTFYKMIWKNTSVISFVDPFPWEPEFDKRTKHDRKKCLAIAGALIAAEIDRLNRIT